MPLDEEQQWLWGPVHPHVRVDPRERITVECSREDGDYRFRVGDSPWVRLRVLHPEECRALFAERRLQGALEVQELWCEYQAWRRARGLVMDDPAWRRFSRLQAAYAAACEGIMGVPEVRMR